MADTVEEAMETVACVLDSLAQDGEHPLTIAGAVAQVERVLGLPAEADALMASWVVMMAAWAHDMAAMSVELDAAAVALVTGMVIGERLGYGRGMGVSLNASC